MDVYWISRSFCRSARSIFHKSRGPENKIKNTGAVASFVFDRPIAQVFDSDLLIVEHNRFFIDQIEHEIHRVQIGFLENIFFEAVVLRSGEKYLGDDDLLSAEEGAIPVFEIHFLFVALAVVRNPEFLGVRLEPDIDQAE